MLTDTVNTQVTSTVGSDCNLNLQEHALNVDAKGPSFLLAVEGGTGVLLILGRSAHFRGLSFQAGATFNDAVLLWCPW